MLRGTVNTPNVDLKQEILKPFYYVKNIKSHTFLFNEFPKAINYWLKIPCDKVNKICELVESKIITMALTDDIQDNAVMRRQVPAAHRLFGTNLTINASTLSLRHFMEDALNLGHENAIAIAINSMKDMLVGQGIEIYWREQMIRPSEEDFKYLTKKKSASAFFLALRLMQLFSDDKRDYSKLVHMIGTYYQIRDDYCNLVDIEALEGQSCRGEQRPIDVNNFCDDITDGKRSLPIIHALRTSPENASTLESILKQQTRDIELKKYCLSIVKNAGSLEYTLDVIHKMDGDIREEIKRLGGNPDLEALLDNFNV